MKENQEFNLAFDFVQFTNRSLFLTGKAGTGKTTFLHKLREASSKRMVVVAPTGVAAINAGGVTIHSFFQLPFGPILPGRLNEPGGTKESDRFIHKFNKKKINLLRTLDLLVIDEVSMVRADLLDGIDHVLRRYKNRRLPFGGVQMLMIGDLQQLAPVVKNEEWQLLKQHYQTLFFFSSHAFREARVVTLELKHVYRQQDEDFITILNQIRNNTLTKASIERLNKRFLPDFRPGKDDGYISLTTHNAQARGINNRQLADLKNASFFYEAEISGNFPEYTFPTDARLELKVGAQVMFVKNDSSYDKRYYNGKIGRIEALTEDSIMVVCSMEEEPIAVERELWENIRFSIDETTKKIEEKVIGTFYQFPLRLAWAITVHKSQGLTFERAIIDVHAAFAHGQTYVALSRCKSLEGLVLSSRIGTDGIILDSSVNSFSRDVQKNAPGQQMLEEARAEYLMVLMGELFGFHSLVYQLEKLGRLCEAHAGSLLGNLPETAEHMLGSGARVLQEVGKRFLPQLKKLTTASSPSGETNGFDDRLKQAAEYFLEKIGKDLEQPARSCSWDTDNKGVWKEIAEVLEKVREQLGIKKACFEVCLKGFDVEEFLHARAVASLEDFRYKKQAVKIEETDEIKHPELLAHLKVWRKEQAMQLGVAHFRIATQKLLLGISNILPASTRQLMQVKGMGPKKMEQFGTAILEIVEAYRSGAGLPAPPDAVGASGRAKKKHSRTVSLELFSSGMQPSEIAKERDLTEQTVVRHLVYFVGTGELPVDRFVEKEQLARILDYFTEHPDALLSEAKTVLGDAVSYNDLHFVRSHMKHINNP